MLDCKKLIKPLLGQKRSFCGGAFLEETHDAT
jgi:hypothetical protein